jgi:ABC-type multidrug transport system ATPase subunit
MTTEDKDVIWSVSCFPSVLLYFRFACLLESHKKISQNISAHIDQIDRLHPYLTVWETLTFSWKCRHAGTHKPPYIDVSDPELKERIQKMDEEQFVTNIVLEGLGLMRVKDTFVGDSTSIRGVSGGEKKRVTVGEFVTIRIPVLCMDEISTGLDGKLLAL